MKKSDIILIAVFLIIGFIGLIIFADKSEGDYVYIYSEGQLYGSYPLAVPETIVIALENGESNTVIIENNTVYVKEASCNNQICVKEGSISKVNETLCCAPNRLIISVGGALEGEYDAITQ